jgi:hypothetical protein
MLIQIQTLTFICLAALTSCTVCSQTKSLAGGGLPNGALPAEVSRSGIKDIQLAQFLENLEASFFSAGSANISKWGTGGYPNNSIDIIEQISAVSAIPTGA